jgi:FixJ family two-component response regulator
MERSLLMKSELHGSSDVVAMKAPQSPEQPVVFVVEDDESLRNALGRLFRMVGLCAEAFATAADFFKRKLPDVPTCLVLDIRLPGVSGLELQADLAKADIKIPIIFMTGHGDIPMSVRAMKAGACEFLPKPFRDQDMLDAVQLALERDRARRQAERVNLQLRTDFESLSAREREVMTFVTAGLMNKQIAAELGLAVGTVKVHRGKLMRKMDVRSVAKLARMAEILGFARPRY